MSKHMLFAVACGLSLAVASVACTKKASSPKAGTVQIVTLELSKQAKFSANLDQKLEQPVDGLNFSGSTQLSLSLKEKMPLDFNSAVMGLNCGKIDGPLFMVEQKEPKKEIENGDAALRSGSLEPGEYLLTAIFMSEKSCQISGSISMEKGEAPQVEVPQQEPSSEDIAVEEQPAEEPSQPTTEEPVVTLPVDNGNTDLPDPVEPAPVVTPDVTPVVTPTPAAPAAPALLGTYKYQQLGGAQLAWEITFKTEGSAKELITDKEDGSLFVDSEFEMTYVVDTSASPARISFTVSKKIVDNVSPAFYKVGDKRNCIFKLGASTLELACNATNDASFPSSFSGSYNENIWTDNFKNTYVVMSKQ